MMYKNQRTKSSSSISSEGASSIAEVDMEDNGVDTSGSIGEQQSAHTNNRLWGAVEIIPNRLYYSPLNFFPPTNENNHTDGDGSKLAKQQQQQQQQEEIHYFTMDDKLLYWNFFLDFGPYNLGQLYRFAQTMNDKLKSNFSSCKQQQQQSSSSSSRSSSSSSSVVICYYSTSAMAQKANAVFLICAYQMLFLGRTLDESYFGFQEKMIEDKVEEGECGDDDDDDDEDGVGVGGKGKSGGGDCSNSTDGTRIRVTSSNTSLPPRTTKMPITDVATPTATTTARATATTTTNMMTTRRGKKEKETENKYNTFSSSSSSSFTRRPWQQQQHQQRQQQQQQSPFAPIHPLPNYHDASPVQCTYELTVYDCLAGLIKARQFHFFNFGTSTTTTPTPTTATATASSTDATTSATNLFDIDEYEYFEQVENGDLNWIISNKILAFAGPQSQRVTTSDGYCVLTPADYIPHFIRWGVQLVIQLNAGGYDPAQFTNTGSIHHVKHVYPDGSCPELHTLHAILSDMEIAIHTNNSAIAVHCKAGLGRTGTCIGAYIMKHYHFTAKEVIGYMRICRPGMVIGPQQHYLSEIQSLMWQEGDVYYGRGIMDGALRIGGRKGDDDNNNNNNDKDAKTKSTTFAIASSSSCGAAPTLSIVTPDGRPFRLSTTPVNSARTLDMDSTPSPMTTTTSSSNKISPTSSSKTSMSLNDDDDNYHTRGDQAETLLSRRLDQYKARTTRQQQH